MKGLIAMLFVSMPAAAQAMQEAVGNGSAHGGMGGGMGMMPLMVHPNTGHFAVAIYALLGALGYLVLQHASKETARYVKRAGVTLGMTLVLLGLLGVLCGVGGHARRGYYDHKYGTPDMMMQGGESAVGEKTGMPGLHDKLVKEKTAEKKAK